MPDINIESMSLDELKAVQKQVEKAIVTFEDRARKEALAAIEAKAREFGFSLNDLTKGAGKKKAPAKYRNPDNPDQTWSGRGRKPGWFADAIAAGRDIGEFEI